MFGHMQFSDYLIDYSLQINTQCLRLLQDHALNQRHTPHAGEQVLDSSSGVLSLSRSASLLLNVRRSRSLWYLVRALVDRELFDAAQDRLGIAALALESLPAHHRMLKTVHKLLKKSMARGESAEVRETLELALLKMTVAQQAENADPLLLSSIFQEESRVWREMDFPPDADETVIQQGYGRVYRSARRSGRRVIQNQDKPGRLLQKWQRWTTLNLYQLDIIKPALREGNRARRWYLDRLSDFLSQYDTLSLLQERLKQALDTHTQGEKVQTLLEQRRARHLTRILKLYPYIYSQKVDNYVTEVRSDITQLALHNVIMLPRSTERRA